MSERDDHTVIDRIEELNEDIRSARVEECINMLYKASYEKVEIIHAILMDL